MRKGFVGIELLRVLSVFGLVVFVTTLFNGCNNKDEDRKARLDKYFSTELKLPSILTSKKTLDIEYDRVPINNDTRLIPQCPELSLKVVESNLTKHKYEVPKLLIRDKKGNPYDAKTKTEYYEEGTQIVWQLCWEDNGTVKIETTEVKHEFLGFKSFNQETLK